MKRTLTILSAALFAGALMVPAVQAQGSGCGARRLQLGGTPAPAAEATPTTKKHHRRASPPQEVLDG